MHHKDPIVKVAVIIVNWNGRKFLEKCLTSVLSQSYAKHKIILVDNGSIDGSTEFVEQTFPDISILRLEKNYGFAYANNVAMGKVLLDNFDFIALLNNDTIVDSNWLKNLLITMEYDRSIGMCASKMLLMETPTILDSTGHVFKWGMIHDRGHGEEDKGQYDGKTDIIGACAGACLYRKELLEDVGLFDEDFGSYYEDAELSWRAFNKGWKAKYVPDAVVYHHRGGTKKRNKDIDTKMEMQLALNVVRTIKRHATLGQKFHVSFAWIILTLVRGSAKLIGANQRGGMLYFKRLINLWL